MQAGEPAPPIQYDEVVISPDGSNWDDANFIGKITLVFFLSNLHTSTDAFFSISNELVDEFQDQPFQFIFIARNWRQQNPLNGWLLRDAEWLTARSWGIERPQVVIIGKDARVPRETVLRLVQQAIESYFSVKPVRQQREQDVYILTLPHGLGPSIHFIRISRRRHGVESQRRQVRASWTNQKHLRIWSTNCLLMSGPQQYCKETTTSV